MKSIRCANKGICKLQTVNFVQTSDSSGDEIANVKFLYDIVRTLQTTDGRAMTYSERSLKTAEKLWQIIQASGSLCILSPLYTYPRLSASVTTQPIQ